SDMTLAVLSVRDAQVSNVLAISPRIPALPAQRPPMKHMILFLAANPLGTDHLALDSEARAIQVERASRWKTSDETSAVAVRAVSTNHRGRRSKRNDEIVRDGGVGRPIAEPHGLWAACRW